MRNRSVKFLVLTCVAVTAILGLSLTGVYDPRRWVSYAQTRREAVPIQFFGKVIDNSGRPVGGAAVSVRIEVPNGACLFGATELKRPLVVEETTAPDGTFVIRGLNGHTLRVESIRKDDHLPNPPPQWYDRGEFGDNWFYYYSPSYGPELRYVPDPSRPALFPLPKFGEEKYRDAGKAEALGGDLLHRPLVSEPGLDQGGRLALGELLLARAESEVVEEVAGTLLRVLEARVVVFHVRIVRENSRTRRRRRSSRLRRPDRRGDRRR